jgi:exopolysaccharide biosynthesis polyprenyl glycosylphosphotransferase
MNETDKTRTVQKPPMRFRSGERRIVLLIGDLFVSSFSLLIALYFWAMRDAWLKFSWEFLKSRPPFWFYLLPLMWIVLLIELYDSRRASRRGDTLKGIMIAAVISLVIYMIIYFTSTPNSLPRRGVAVFLICTTLFTTIWRLIYIRIFTAPRFLRRMLIVGAGRAGSTLAGIIRSIKPRPFDVVGMIDDDPEKRGLVIEGFPVLGYGTELLSVIEKESITDLIFAISHEMNPAMFRSLVNAEEQGVEITTMPRVYEELTGRVPVFLLQSDWLLRSFVDQYHANGFYEAVKRVIDIIGGLVGLSLLAILFPLVALLILIDSGIPLIFKQTRLGRSGFEYEIRKFRTMHKDAEADGQARMAQENDERVTRLGKFLRKSHIDELPQFINVIKGEMSLIGPRAERPEFVDKLQEKIPFYRARLFVKPGLTGWAQVNQRYAATVEESGVKLEYDLYYIKNRNLLLDLLILVRTVGAVFSLKGQ